MSMGIFGFYVPDGIRVSPKGWVYAAITVPLTFTWVR